VVSGPPGRPRDWTLNEEGKPGWIADVPYTDLSLWSFLVIPPDAPQWRPSDQLPEWAKEIRSRGPRQMPRIPLVQEPRPTPPGRPTTGEAEPGSAAYAVWLRDIKEVINLEIADALAFGAIDDRARRRRASKLVRDGRKRLQRSGVLPWVCWEDGKLEDGWWTSPRFGVGLKYWYEMLVANRDFLRELWGWSRDYAKAAAELDRRRRQMTRPDDSRGAR
jgi:hypothetical protein